jgi:predicted transcriptional regulator of viral defense system
MEKERSAYTNLAMAGLGRRSRVQLSALLRRSAGTLTPELAAGELGLSSVDAAKLLARWAAQGWLRRVRRGIYVPVPLESERAEVAPEDSWVVAEAAFAPCFISGWSAAEHWGLTEQVFRTVSVSTTRRPRNRAPTLGGIGFRVRTVPQAQFFGLKTVWRGRTRVKVTDPSRTIVDLLADPSLGGGARASADMLQNYLASKEYRNVGQLLSYAETLGVGAVFKRLGYFLERFAPEERDAIARCARSLTKGNARLDPTLAPEKLVTRWRLWLPNGWQAP